MSVNYTKIKSSCCHS